MRKTVLYIAMSLDGYIADGDGGVDWLQGQGDGEDVDTYSEFVKSVDTVLMGWNTYHQIVTELSPGAWVYGDLDTVVFTHHKAPSAERICFTDEDPAQYLQKLQKESGKDIWVCGGAQLVGRVMEEDLIDRYHIALIPVLLGGGVRLFSSFPGRQELRLEKTLRYNGIVELIYERRQPRA